MIELKTEQQIREFFKDNTLKFEIMVDGVADYLTVLPILIDGNYYNFKVSFFTKDNPFAAYDNCNGLLSVCQVFEVYALDTRNQETHHLYQNKYEENYNYINN